MSKNQIIETLKATPPMQIASLDFVREKFVDNYNRCHGSDSGELMYHRQLVHFNQQIAASDLLKKADSFSLYACFVTAAVNGYSLDPQDNEVYLLPIKGNAHLWRQAGAHIRRLKRTKQIQFAEQAKIVYEGDVFEVENGRVVKHVEKFTTENMVAGYVRFVVDSKGTDRFFIYRRSDWESWRKKSPNPKTIQKTGQNGPYLSESLWDNGIVNGTNPEPNFLRTKIVKHAAQEKCWATGSIPADADTFANIEIDADPDEIEALTPNKMTPDDHYSDFEDVANEHQPVDTVKTDDDDTF